MTCYKYQVYLYGSEAITYLNAILQVIIEPALWVIRLPLPPPPPPSQHYRQPSLPLYGSITFTHWEENSSLVKLPYLYKNPKEKTGMVEEPSHVNQLILNHVCKIGLKTENKNEIVKPCHQLKRTGFLNH